MMDAANDKYVDDIELQKLLAQNDETTPLESYRDTLNKYEELYREEQNPELKEVYKGVIEITKLDQDRYRQRLQCDIDYEAAIEGDKKRLQSLKDFVEKYLGFGSAFLLGLGGIITTIVLSIRGVAHSVKKRIDEIEKKIGDENFLKVPLGIGRMIAENVESSLWKVIGIVVVVVVVVAERKKIFK